MSAITERYMRADASDRIQKVAKSLAAIKRPLEALGDEGSAAMLRVCAAMRELDFAQGALANKIEGAP
jgi:hypothetical protein